MLFIRIFILFVEVVVLCRMLRVRMLVFGRGEWRVIRRVDGVVCGRMDWKGMGERSFVRRERSGEGFWVVRVKRREVRWGRRVGRMLGEFVFGVSVSGGLGEFE